MVIAKRLSVQRLSALQWLMLLGAILVLLDVATFFVAEALWFQALGYLQVFRTHLLSQVGLGLVISGSSLGFLWSNLGIARQLDWTKQSPWKSQSSGWYGNRMPQPLEVSLPGALTLRWLLPLSLWLSLLIGVMVIYHGQIAISHWHPNLNLQNNTTRIPVKFRLDVLWQVGQQMGTQPWQVGLLAGFAIALLIYPRILLGAIALLLSLGFGLVVSEHWATVLAALNATPFGRVDPLFGRDISFFIFLLPAGELLEFWLIGLFTLAFLAVTLIYLLSGNSLSQGVFPGFSHPQQRHLVGLGGCLLLTISLSYWLDRYELLYSTTGVVYGASYTNTNVQLPANTVLSLLALVIGVFLLGRSLVWRTSQPPAPSQPPRPSLLPPRYVLPPAPPSASQPLLYAIALYLGLTAIATLLLPFAVQRLVVQPNELALEQPYIERAIALTREAFNLDVIDVESFNPQYTLNAAALARNDLTVDNIRLWDTRPLLDTNRQLQRIRPYYEFPDADIDRYTLPNEDGGTFQQQVLIAARELDYNSVPAEAQTWLNQHLIYTHGYGFTLSPVNTAGESGLPDYFIQGIEQTIQDERIRTTIPTAHPRIYYGEITDNYVLTQTRVRELDYPSGSDNVYNTYDGRGDVAIGSLWRRLLYAKHLRDWRMLLTDNFTPQTRLLFRRKIDSRVRAIAPFLRYDTDPYLVVVDTQDENAATAALTSNASTPNYLYWIIDAYTTSDRYPYSDPGGNDFNYIRNSVKVVVDAYHGSVRFYVADFQDPLIQTWNRIFPDMFQPLSALSPALRLHIRYPQDFYRVQSDQLMVYHMTDPQVFYNREDQWRAPNEIYADEPQLVEPYYLIMKLPADTTEEFILFRPFTPNQRTNLIAWLAARSDGENYGRMLLYRFPKQELVFGPEQLEARINQEPAISQQISLWNRRGSRAIQGNLLVIPIERSLLYTEPLYLEAEHNRLPILARVIVAYANRIVMAETLQQALDAIFAPEASPATPAIIRSLEE